MKKNLLNRAAAALAAAATTFVVFSTVAGLADGDREQLLAAKSRGTMLADTGRASAVR